MFLLFLAVLLSPLLLVLLQVKYRFLMSGAYLGVYGMFLLYRSIILE
ncbi:hypothetical protein JNUCC42_12100 [Brevibacterium sp. JNUCC-42]|nr:hypothetical protein JNUCC42_12100 [Brevibacterium sp. JNUCC-42]